MFLHFTGANTHEPILINTDHIISVQEGLIRTTTGTVHVKDTMQDIQDRLAYADRKEAKR